MDDICRHVLAIRAHVKRVIYCNSDRRNSLPDQIWIYICDDSSRNRHTDHSHFNDPDSDDDHHVWDDDDPFHQSSASSRHQTMNLMTARAQLDGHALGQFSYQAARIRAHILPSRHDEVSDRRNLLFWSATNERGSLRVSHFARSPQQQLAWDVHGEAHQNDDQSDVHAEGVHAEGVHCGDGRWVLVAFSDHFLDRGTGAHVHDGVFSVYPCRICQSDLAKKVSETQQTCLHPETRSSRSLLSLQGLYHARDVVDNSHDCQTLKIQPLAIKALPCLFLGESFLLSAFPLSNVEVWLDVTLFRA